MSQPPPKKHRTDGEENAEVLPAVKEPMKELESDAPVLKARQNATVAFNVPDTTLNVMISSCGNMLRPLMEGCCQHLLAGGRASVGIKSGRYMFETKIVEVLNPSEDGKRSLLPKQLVRVGFSTERSSLFLDDTDSVCFDSEGVFIHGTTRSACGETFARDCTVALVLNLDSASPNCNTVSLFKEGVRASPPQPIPESLRGKALYPTVTFRNVTMHTNFGPEPYYPLPFRCHMIQSFEKVDAVVTPPPPQADRHEILFPIGLPDEGVFDWVDMFIKQNPRYTELSERSILAWAEKSGMRRNSSSVRNSSKDQPEMNFGVPSLDDRGCGRLLQSLASVQNRDYIVMELGRNLSKEERAESLLRFPKASFKKVAQVLVGEPAKDFKDHTKALLLKDKQDAAVLAFKAKKEADMRKKLMAKRQNELEKAKKKAEKQRLKLEEEKKRKLEEDKEESEKKDSKDGDEPKKDTTEKEEEDDEEEKEDADEMDECPPTVELTEEEANTKFHKSAIPDMAPIVVGKFFTKFSLPTKEEGFDETRYIWNKQADSEDYLKQWILGRKLTTRVEDLVPSPWFKTKWSIWQKTCEDWAGKQASHKASLVKKEALKRAEANSKAMAAAKAAADKLKKDAEKKTDEKDGKGEEKEKEEVAEPEEAAKADAADEEELVDFDNLDVFGVEDVCDLGGGMPLFKDFLPEDWTMTSLRFEIYLLVHAFKRDCGDPERTGIHLDHLCFYYNKYFKKTLSIKAFAVDSIDALLALVADTLFVTPQRVIETFIPDELESLGVFAKITEEARRARILAVDAGDESARLKIQFKILGAGSSFQDGSHHKGHHPRSDAHSSKGSGKSWNQAGGKGKGYQAWNQGGGKGGFKSHPYGQRSW